MLRNFVRRTFELLCIMNIPSNFFKFLNFGKDLTREFMANPFKTPGHMKKIANRYFFEPVGKLRIGSPVPDVPLVTPNGKAVNLKGLINDKRLLVLIFGSFT